ncbi:inactive tyrosine-protein kinase PRAG1 [Periophthalmus magnuspinnatus]|uniref:inactive tyrosine-protein kinase PRAG1 n=1 Tax=Periophthalmus magnuspinnatus TaxID=409849 RepID=UPI00145AE519|nr:inactive tyrosine-protein kinase PRAG1 [Periophthalmus magnuspinnatus]
MESGCLNQTGGHPPALPVKHHRQRSSSHRGSSMGSDSTLLSPGPQLSNNTLNDVFEKTDCHAASCPIHQDLDSVHHMRFLSDNNPPPVPKKRLVRTLSLPANHVPALSPLSPCLPLQMHPHNFDNPLYMLTPVRDTLFSKESSGLGAASRSSTAPLLPLSQLSFNTSDEHLVNFFVSFEDQDTVSKTIQHRHLLFLRDMVQKMEANLLLKEELSEKPVSSYQPQDFLLDEGSEPKTIAGKIYYSVHSPKFPGRILGLRIITQTELSASTCTNPQPAHVNVKHVVAHFQPTSNVTDSCIKTEFVNSVRGCTAAISPCGGSNEYANYSGSRLLSTVQHLLWKGHSVAIERDLPSATLEDFVQEIQSMQNMDCVLYDKRVCFLLLQILQGAQHLYKNICGPGLKPQEILLVWPGRTKTEPESSHAKSKKNEALNSVTETGLGGYIQMLWETQGCPRVVISSQTSGVPVSQSLVSIKANIGALIQYCLNVHKGLAALYMSTYRNALLYLASQLKDNSSGLNIDDMTGVLQVVLWGPGAPLMKHIGMSTALSWLSVKRALLVMKLAEKGVDHTALDWQDILCLQYIAFTEPQTVINEIRWLELTPFI